MKTKKYIPSILISILSLLLGTGLHSQIDQEIGTKLDAYLSVQEERIGLSGTVLIADNQNILYERATGMASHELEVPIQMETKFKIASISKSFTGMLLALAEREGRLRLDDSLKQYFPERKMSARWGRITLGQLVSHTSGIPHWKGYRDYWPVRSRMSLGTEHVLSDIFNMELIEIPDGEVRYSSPAYYVLATVLEKVYGKPYGDILTEKITGPLEMEATGVCDGNGIVTGMASGYHRLSNDSLIVAPHRDMATMKGGGGLYSNAYDLLDWNRSLMGEGPWDRALLDRYLNPAIDVKFSDAVYALGQYVHPKKDGRPKAYRAAGGTFGFSSISAVYPEEGISLIVLSNVSFLPVKEIWRDLEKIVFKRPFELPGIVRETEISNERLATYPGTYVSINGMELKIAVHNEDLYAKLSQNPPLKLAYYGDHNFRALKLNIGFEFTLTANGKVDGVIADGKGQVHTFKRK